MSSHFEMVHRGPVSRRIAHSASVDRVGAAWYTGLEILDTRALLVANLGFIRQQGAS